MEKVFIEEDSKRKKKEKISSEMLEANKCELKLTSTLLYQKQIIRAKESSKSEKCQLKSS